MSDLDNFKAWFVDVLNGLYPNRHAGLAVFMISLPLAERYLRQKNNLGSQPNLNDAFMVDLTRMFPALRDILTVWDFWTTYRHGFLHQATLALTRKGMPLPVAWLTHDIADAVQIRSDGTFCVHPVLFSKVIIGEIEANFAVFTGLAAGAPPLSDVARMDPVTIPSTYIGTGNRP